MGIPDVLCDLQRWSGWLQVVNGYPLCTFGCNGRCRTITGPMLTIIFLLQGIYPFFARGQPFVFEGIREFI